MSIKINGMDINLTMFPDNTSQVWKLSDEILNAERFNIVFDFDHEGEIFHLQQLVDLLKLGRVPCKINLHMPYLPYGRQDKQISNSTTFALHVFADIINGMRFDSVTSIDTHSDVASDLIDNFKNIYPEDAIRTAHHSISNFETDAYNTSLAYPDSGAFVRYGKDMKSSIIGEKVRDQLTGYIKQYDIQGEPSGKDILIIDDICDGGMTFILMTKELLKKGARSVNLYVTHGIFSKGLDVLREAGIERIFTKDGEIK